MTAPNENDFGNVTFHGGVSIGEGGYVGGSTNGVGGSGDGKQDPNDPPRKDNKQATIKAYEPDMADRWRDGNIAQQLTYGFADGIYSMFADNHLGGRGFNSYDDKIKTRLGGLMTLGGPLFSTESAIANTGRRVFWSGEYIAQSAAEDFAKANGMKTLEMTLGGRIMRQLNRTILPKSSSISSYIWNSLSTNFANGAKGSVNIFHNASGGVRLESTWRAIEYPILKQNKVNMIFHDVK
ncbi:hypothetical protein [Spirosoma foliorum]|uniref:Uncharacterized protein n=1 Tax=Spirosoma foliorum TaxID=2710596 RepID=A0A7G5GVG4_9BACT|nr:hypothetical protein [Spirosoma foliorum]QMW02856.1 hypothetical protein H3H32_34025 [Spirosoma foliorum]